jgi:hypothetical protein
MNAIVFHKHSLHSSFPGDERSDSKRSRSKRGSGNESQIVFALFGTEQEYPLHPDGIFSDDAVCMSEANLDINDSIEITTSEYSMSFSLRISILDGTPSFEIFVDTHLTHSALPSDDAPLHFVQSMNSIPSSYVIRGTPLSIFFSLNRNDIMEIRFQPLLIMGIYYNYTS